MAQSQSRGTGYDALAACYEDIYDDWDQVVRSQGELLSDLLASRLGSGSLTILDAACGIGTQAIGLALQGHKVVGADASGAAVERAQVLAKRFGVELPAVTVDIREIDTRVDGPFDTVIACDNALPHLLTDDDLVRACGAVRRTLRPGGVFLASVRDYGRFAGQQPSGSPVRRLGRPEARRLVFQTWEWLDECMWRPELFILRERESGWDTTSFVLPAYRGITTDYLAGLMIRAGFAAVEIRSPESSGYYQPILIARQREG